jgi:hypothetical protein
MERRDGPHFQLGRILVEIADAKKIICQYGKHARGQLLGGSCAPGRACPAHLSYIGETTIFVSV